MLKRQSAAHEVEGHILRTRAMLVERRPQKSSLTTGKPTPPEDKPRIADSRYETRAIGASKETPAEVIRTQLNPGTDSADGVSVLPSGSKALSEDYEKFKEMSRILEESVPKETKV